METRPVVNADVGTSCEGCSRACSALGDCSGGRQRTLGSGTTSITLWDSHQSRHRYTPYSIGVAEAFDPWRTGVVPKFNSDLKGFAVSHMGKRNEELHSGKTPFDSGDTKWQARYYESCDILLQSMGESLELLFGAHQAGYRASPRSPQRTTSRLNLSPSYWIHIAKPGKPRVRLKDKHRSRPSDRLGCQARRASRGLSSLQEPGTC